MPNTVKIVVLADGDSWDTFGSVMTITEDAYNRLLSGEDTLGTLDRGTDIVSDRGV